MPYYKLKVAKQDNNFIYPVPDINKISNPKYKNDLSECVAIYPDIIDSTDATEITQQEYENYGFVQISIDKQQIQSDSIDTATITATIPESNQQLRLLVNDSVVALENSDANGQVTFLILADASLVGSVLEITAESDLWKPSGKLYLEVV